VLFQPAERIASGTESQGNEEIDFDVHLNRRHGGQSRMRTESVKAPVRAGKRETAILEPRTDAQEAKN